MGGQKGLPKGTMRNCGTDLASGFCEAMGLKIGLGFLGLPVSAKLPRL